MDIRLTPSHLKGRINAVSSKSDAHRILIASALSDSETVIECNALSNDILATINCLNALGADIKTSKGEIIVKPIKKAEKKAELDCAESGSTLRFLLPVAAALGVNAVFSGEGRLPERPLEPLKSEMIKNGVSFTPDGQFPVEISGRLKSGKYVIAGNVSSQFVTGLLFALPLCGGKSTLELTGTVESRSYIDMTLSTLSKFGIEILQDKNQFIIKGNQKYVSPKLLAAQGDWSNSAFFLVAGALGEGVTVTGLERESCQGDKAVLKILKQMGASVRWNKNSVTVRGGELKGVAVDAGDIPDLVPVLAVAAVAAKSGVTTFTNASRLRLKECDRLEAMRKCLDKIGAVVAETDDGLIVWSGEKIRGGAVSSFNDHRIAMSMAIASLLTDTIIIINDAQAVCKSYPDFFEDFNKLGGKADVINN